MRILKTSELKARTGAILDKAKHAPVYVERNGTLLVISKARLAPAQDDPLLAPWDLRFKAIESFYDAAKAW